MYSTCMIIGTTIAIDVEVVKYMLDLDLNFLLPIKQVYN